MITIFYIVAGWVMAMKDSKISTRELMRRRLRSLGLPYLYWSLIILAFDCVLWALGYYDTYFIARETYKTIVLRGIGTLWFLPALFFGELIWNWLRRRNIILWITLLAVFIIYNYYYSLIFSSHTSTNWKILQAPFFTISNALNAIICVAAGWFLFRVVSRLNMSTIRYFIFGMICCGLGYLTANYLPFMIGIKAANLMWGLLAPIIGPLGFLLIFRSIQNSSLLNYFDFWGRNSLSLMVTHYSFVQVLITIFITRVLHHTFCGWITIWAFVASMPIQYFITVLLNKYYPRLIRPC